jgi:hypothetical protein
MASRANGHVTAAADMMLGSAVERENACQPSVGTQEMLHITGVSLNIVCFYKELQYLSS